MTNYNQTLRSVCEELGWSIYEEKETVELSQHSPAGEDFSFCVEKKNFIKNVENYMTDFDADEHAAELIANRGKYGIPLSVRVLIDDADDIQEMLNKLWVSLDKTKQNKWENIFQYWLDLTEFTLIKHRRDGLWSVRDDQGANLGDIESQRFQSSIDLVDRFADSIYFNDYILRELEDYFKSEEDNKFIEEQWNKNLGECDNWLNIAKNNPKFCEGREWAFDIIEMFMHHTDKINLENCYYEEED